MTDPLDAAPGAVIDGRFRLIRRLGRGSTAVGLLVTDLAAAESGPESTRVLKVALDDAGGGPPRRRGQGAGRAAPPPPGPARRGPARRWAAGRPCCWRAPATRHSAEVLREPRTALPGPAGTVGHRPAGGADRAGPGRGRPPGHQARQPRHPGGPRGPGQAPGAVRLLPVPGAAPPPSRPGTPPYLDPFLDAPGAAGTTPPPNATPPPSCCSRWRPAPLPGSATGCPTRRPSVTRPRSSPACSTPPSPTALVPFFRTALARNAKERLRHRRRHAGRVAGGLRRRCPRPSPTTPTSAPPRPRPATPLAEAGLSARALSALEPYGVATVGDLVAVDPVRLNRLSGVADATRGEVKTRARQWRDKFGAAVTGRGPDRRAGSGPGSTSLPDPVTAAELLLAHAGTARAASRRAAARLLLGLDPGLDPFSSQNELGEVLAVTRARVAQQVGCPARRVGRPPSLPRPARQRGRDRPPGAHRLRRCRHRGRTGRRGPGGAASRGGECGLGVSRPDRRGPAPAGPGPGAGAAPGRGR